MKQDHYKTIGVIIAVLIAVFTYFFFAEEKKVIEELLYVALVLALITYSWEKAAIFIAKYWMKLGKFFGDINAKIILSVFFLFIINPLAILKKVFGAKKRKNKNSNWQEVKEKEVLNFKNPW